MRIRQLDQFGHLRLTSTIQKLSKVSCIRIAYGPNPRIFPVAEFSCSTVYGSPKSSLVILCVCNVSP